MVLNLYLNLIFQGFADDVLEEVQRPKEIGE